MARSQAPMYSLNGGEVGRGIIQRLDLEKLRFAGELYDNILPSVIGPVQFRGGFQYRVDAAVNEADNVFMKFVYGNTNNFLIHFSSNGARIYDADAGDYITRASVSTTIVDPDFDNAAMTDWTDTSTGTATATVDATTSQAILTANSSDTASIEQEVTIISADDTVEHGLAIDIDLGPIGVKIGTTSGDDDILSYSGLAEGSHRLAFTPGDGVTSIFITLYNTVNKGARVASCDIESAGALTIITPWGTSDLSSLRKAQSSDVIFVASDGYQQRRIERRGNTSWSIVRYLVDDGPFDILPDDSISLSADNTTGDVTITASDDLFAQSDVGSLFRMVHYSQFVTDTLSAAAETSDSIIVTGSGAEDRTFSYSIVGTGFTGTVSLDRSIGSDADFTEYQSFTTDASGTINDELDNQIVYYRFRMSAYTAGSAAVELDYEGGVTYGVIRITNINTALSAGGQVLSPLAETTATTQWDRGSWSDRNGWPSAVTFFDGRLWWGRDDIVYGSTSDAFDTFDDLSEDDLGDSAPVVRSIGTDTTEGILWLQGLQRLAAGTALGEYSIRASSFDEPITSSSFTPREASTRGSADIEPVKVDSDAIFVQRSSDRAYRFAFSSERNDYFAFEVTKFNRDILTTGVVRVDVQRHPDTRIWFLLSNGEARVLTYELEDDVLAWSRVTMDNGIIEDLAVLPSATEDRVLALVQRTINSATVRYIEELAFNSDAVGATQNLMADSFVTGSQTASTTVSGLDHLEGESVVVWADGAAVHDYWNPVTVTSGSITCDVAVADYVVGLSYAGQWTSTDLAYGSEAGTALTQRKRVSHLGLVMQDVCLAGIRIGRDSSNLKKLRPDNNGRQQDFGEVLDTYNYDASAFGGDWDPNSRLNVNFYAPYPATLKALVLSMNTEDMDG